MYLALKELSSNKNEHGLGGLALALSQARSYTYRNGLSFVSYIELFNNTRNQAVETKLFIDAEDNGLSSEEQRSIWTSWKIYVRSFSDSACEALFAVACFGTESISMLLFEVQCPNSNIQVIVFNNIVREELFHRFSLLNVEKFDNETALKMHCPIHPFVLFNWRDRCSINEEGIGSCHLCNSLLRCIFASRIMQMYG